MERAPLGLAARISILLAPVLSAYAVAGLTPILPKVGAHFAATPGVGWLTRLMVTSIGIAMLFAPFTGILARKLGWRRALILGLIGYAAFGVAGGMIDNLWLIVATRFGLGLSTAIIATLLVSLIAVEMEGDQRNRWLGYVMVTGTLGALVLVPISGFLGKIDWRLPFGVHAIALVVVVLVASGIPHSVGAPPQHSPKSVDRAAFPWGIVILGLATGALVSTQTLYTPFHLADIGVHDPGIVGLTMLPGALVGAVVSIFYGRWRRSVSLNATFIICFAVMAAGLLLVGFAATLPILLAGQAVIGLGLGFVTPNLYAFAALVGRDIDKTRNMGLARGAYFAAPFLAQFALEPIAGLANAGMALAALGIFGLVAALVVRAMMPRALAVAA
ncbi:MFS transporter [Sphingomonas montanisoli]|uniref:MFS transporter n=1 Tax=Sphingomonas montanisoli TaxID=2606412 RepID=A0A5D9CAA6_9SPHN|nr:MFS transporter [Sphingomonas montanisoli]TZG28629.1 MFS transporter [Sphingomonas montanisoli]